MTTVLALGVLTACGGDDDDPVVTVSPSVSPSSTPETPSPLPMPVTTDKPTDRQTIPPQN